MVDFDRLFELLEKADMAADCDCRVTTLAYLKIAQREAYDQVGRTETAGERRRLLRAAQYVERKLLAIERFTEAAHFAWAFWRGFENGWESRTMPMKASKAYQMGRRLATINFSG